MKEQSIIEAAKQLFIEKGYRETSVADIVRASGSSKGNLYHHFKNKEALFLKIIEKDDDHWLHEWSLKSHEFNNAREKFIGLATYSATRQTYHPMRSAVAEFYALESHYSSEIKAKIKEIDDRYTECFMDIIQEGNRQEEWNVGDPWEVSEIASALSVGMVMLYGDYPIEERKRRYVKSAEIFLDGLS
ncbi:TetR/AcrR family transcriptional regulator [Geomicrobium sp. JSM 1781026]|uniref:TetR/AcrR family transcriptional regulator n=1 Tax=Geomicrobium sp. JSM 1781026 TaxID=3344580 RepID=UPI0035C26189